MSDANALPIKMDLTNAHAAISRLVSCLDRQDKLPTFREPEGQFRIRQAGDDESGTDVGGDDAACRRWCVPWVPRNSDSLIKDRPRALRSASAPP